MSRAAAIGRTSQLASRYTDWICATKLSLFSGLSGRFLLLLYCLPWSDCSGPAVLAIYVGLEAILSGLSVVLTCLGGTLSLDSLEGLDPSYPRYSVDMGSSLMFRCA